MIMTAIWPVITGRQKRENLKKPLDSITDYSNGSFLTHLKKDSLERKLGQTKIKSEYTRSFWKMSHSRRSWQDRPLSIFQSMISDGTNELWIWEMKVDGLKSGQSQKLTVSKVDGLNSGSQKWTIWKVDGFKIGWFQEFRISKLDDLISERSRDLKISNGGINGEWSQKWTIPKVAGPKCERRLILSVSKMDDLSNTRPCII